VRLLIEDRIMSDYLADIGKVGGVWLGSYRRMQPDGRLIEAFSSRQVSRAEGSTWHEQITYTWEDGRSKTMDFVAKLREDGVHVYDEDTLLQGRTYLSGAGQVIFPYSWHDRPGVKVLEVQHYLRADKRTRIWQRFEQDTLTEIMVIQETRESGPGGAS
jgi:hypothetical protein